VHDRRLGHPEPTLPGGVECTVLRLS
jgi:hypothetical protein